MARTCFYCGRELHSDQPCTCAGYQQRNGQAQAPSASAPSSSSSRRSDSRADGPTRRVFRSGARPSSTVDLPVRLHQLLMKGLKRLRTLLLSPLETLAWGDQVRPLTPLFLILIEAVVFSYWVFSFLTQTRLGRVLNAVGRMSPPPLEATYQVAWMAGLLFLVYQGLRVGLTTFCLKIQKYRTSWMRSYRMGFSGTLYVGLFLVFSQLFHFGAGFFPLFLLGVGFTSPLALDGLQLRDRYQMDRRQAVYTTLFIHLALMACLAAILDLLFTPGVGFHLDQAF